MNQVTFMKGAGLVVGCLMLGGTILVCSEPEGLRLTAPGQGPQVIFDVDARPFAEIPFPNDLITRPDPGSATGRRINVSLLASTELEQSVRAKIDRLDGFGTFAPIWVRFDTPLDVNRIKQVRHDDGDRSDDQILVLVVDPQSPYFGEAAYLDLGQGYFPIGLELNDNYFASDPRSSVSNLLFDTEAEDKNRNGLLDLGEDSDSDGVLDVPNVYPGSPGDPYRDLIPFYERETNTLMIRPVNPLRERTRYAVVLTNKLRGANEEPVRSPFPYVHHLDQFDDLGGLEDALAIQGRALDEVAFAWSFTTMSIHADLDALRSGLHGEGPFAQLQAQYSPDPYLHQLRDDARGFSKNLYLVGVDEIRDILATTGEVLLPAIGASPSSLEPLLDSYQFVDYFVSGSFDTPYLLDNPEEVWDLDPQSGRLNVGEQEVTFWLSVPKAHRHTFSDGSIIEFKPPFPVVVYIHGTTSTRLETLGWAGTLGRYGFAVLGIDAVGHGLLLSQVDSSLDQLISSLFSHRDLLGMYRAIKTDRARDLDRDGFTNSGGDFWSADIFHTRDVVRQTALDAVQAVRMLRSFDGNRRFKVRQDPRTDPQRGPRGEQKNCFGETYPEGKVPFSGDANCDGSVDLAGDFNGDGVVDVGGPDNLIVATGVSLGGIVSSVFAGVEPDIARAVPISGGGGLADIAIRTLQPGVVESVFLKLFGPLIVGVPYAPISAEPVVFDSNSNRTRFHTQFHIDQILGIWADTDRFHQGEDFSPGALFVDNLVVLRAKPPDGINLMVDYDARYVPELNSIPPQKASVRVLFDVANVDKEARLVIRDLVDVQEGDQIYLTNLANGESRVVWANPYGSFRIAVPSDSTEDVDAPPSQGLFQSGDELALEIFGADGNLKARIDQFERDFVWHATSIRAGDPLVSLTEGLALRRNTPQLRRYVSLCQMILDPADPVNWGMRSPDRMLVVLTVGDMNAPINTGISLARAASLLRFDPLAPDPVPERYKRQDGLTEHQLLFDWWVVEGLEKLDRFPEFPRTLADPDDLDLGKDGFHAPTPKVVLRATRYDESGKAIAGVRFPYVKPYGWHAFRVPAPNKAFDIDSFMINMMGKYFLDGEVDDSPCLEDYSCDFIPKVFEPLP